MSLPIKTTQQLYQLIQTNFEDYAPDLTDWNPGSDLDITANVFSIGGTELERYIADQFNKTFIQLANGPAITLGPDDLQTLAVDHYGPNFGRPGATFAVDTATFSRPNNSAGAKTIPAGSIIQTKPDANGNVQQYQTNSSVLMTNNSSPSDLNVTIGVTALVAGSAGNAAAGTINVIVSTLGDTSITVSNTGNSTGTDAQDDADYRQTIYNLIQALAGATAAAVAAKALTVSGVKTATAIEQMLPVIQYNIATNTTVGRYFYFPIPTLYIADSTGTANATLINNVLAAINLVRACGVLINVIAATAVTVNWTASITLNPSGPNYSTFVNNPAAIITAMTAYIQGIAVGTGFVRATANAAILAIFGPSGTNDLTAFTTSVPSGDVAATATQKMVAGTVVLS